MRISAINGEVMQPLIVATKALSDETRVRILNLLLQRECCVCEVMQALDISQSRAARNLGILQSAGLLKARRSGTWMLYSVDWETSNRHITPLFELLKDWFANDSVLAEDRERLKKVERIGLPCG